MSRHSSTGLSSRCRPRAGRRKGIGFDMAMPGQRWRPNSSMMTWAHRLAATALPKSRRKRGLWCGDQFRQFVSTMWRSTRPTTRTTPGLERFWMVRRASNAHGAAAEDGTLFYSDKAIAATAPREATATQAIYSRFGESPGDAMDCGTPSNPDA